MTQYETDKNAIKQLEDMATALMSYDPKDRLEAWLYLKQNLADTIITLQALGSIYVDLETMDRITPEQMSNMHEATKYMAVEWLKFAINFAETVPTKIKAEEVQEKKKSFLDRLFG